MNTSARTLSIIADIAPALEAARRADGYYPAPVAVRSIIAARHGEAAANTLYHNGLVALIQQHVAPLYSGKGAREFAAAARKLDRQPLQGFDWWNAHPSPFVTALDWLHWRLERAKVGDVIRCRSDLLITRSDDTAFKVRYGNRVMPVNGGDYGHAVASLMVALLFGLQTDKQVRSKPERLTTDKQIGIVSVV